jgi:hypothetical protein
MFKEPAYLQKIVARKFSVRTNAVSLHEGGCQDEPDVVLRIPLNHFLKETIPQRPVGAVHPAASVPSFAIRVRSTLFQGVTPGMERRPPGGNKYLEKIIFRSILEHEKLRSVYTC